MQVQPENIKNVELPIPDFYNPQQVGQVWRVPYQERASQARAWAVQHALRPASQDSIKIALVLIDLQNTFCVPDFELFVGGKSGLGAVYDNQRLCQFIYHNLGRISHIAITMDTHRAMQVFHPIYLVDAHGEHPAPLTLVSHADVEAGRWRFNPQAAASLGVTPEQGQRMLRHYTAELQRLGKYELTIWPYHAMLGGVGHALVSAIEEAVFFHTIARNAQAEFLLKGQFAASENYSAISPEVLAGPDGEALGARDERLIDLVAQYDAVLVAGQAKSHCVAWTLDDLLEQIITRDASLARKVYLLEDCTSPVVVPGVVDYSPQAAAAFQRFAEAGMHILRSSQVSFG